MNIVTHTEHSPYASAPLEHLALSLRDHLAARPGTLHLSWNTLRPEVPHTLPHFLSGDLTLTMETPLFGRHLWQFDGSPHPASTYYRLALHDPSVLYGGFRILPDSPRRDKIFKNCGYTIEPISLSSSRDHILYALQVPGDTSLKGINILEAALWDLYELKRRTSRPVVVALHPDCFSESWASSRLVDQALHLDNLRHACRLLGHKILRPDERTHDYFPGCHCCVTYTSGLSFEALLAGIPAITLHRGSFQHPITCNDLHAIERPHVGDRLQWWSKLAHIQYTWHEIATGHHLDTIDALLAP